jgi:hypothetical protein
MNRKYRGWTLQERQREYARLKSEWTNQNGHNEKAYDDFVDRLARELGV